MDIHITYETLFDLLRKERSLEELQELDKQFWHYVIDYLKERQAFYDKISSIEQEKMRIQLNNIKRILREIYERREQKILQLAINVIRTENVGFVDTRNMLYEERLLFDESITLLKKYKTGVLDQIFIHEVPTMAASDYAKDDIVAETKAASASTLSTRGFDSERNTPNVDEAKLEDDGVTPTANEERVPEEPTEKAPEKLVTTQSTQTKEGTLLVKFINAVPKFHGRDKEIFGPYDVGTITSLPENIANILLKKEKVEKVVAE